MRGDELVEGLFDGRHDDPPYLVHRDESVSQAEVRGAAARGARLFAGQGISQGSTVGLQMPPSFTQVEVLLALWLIARWHRWDRLRRLLTPVIFAALGAGAVLSILSVWIRQ